MGVGVSMHSVDRLFDATVETIDLRTFIMTGPSTSMPNVTIYSTDTEQFLFLWYLGDYWNLGKIVKTHYVSSYTLSESVVTVATGRKYVIYTDVPILEKPGFYRNIDDHIKVEPVYKPKLENILK